MIRQALLTLFAFGVVLVGSVQSATIATPTYDNDSYMFVGLNNEFENAISLSEDFSAGIVAENNAHFIFGLIKFGDLNGLATKATGGGDKYLRLSTANFPGPATIGVSIAGADIEANDATGYPSPLFAGNTFGSNRDRLRWFHSNIKSNNGSYGGYAGGATHVGVIEFPAPGTYYLNVTTAVDSWISGTRPNFGFGIWSIEDAGEQGNNFDLVSMSGTDVDKRPALVNSIPGSTPERKPGDANEDGVVNRLDLGIVVAGFGRTTGATWATGDFNSDGLISLADLNILHANLSLSGSPSATAVPEPSSLALGAIAVVALIGARIRRKQISLTA